MFKGFCFFKLLLAGLKGALIEHLIPLLTFLENLKLWCNVFVINCLCLIKLFIGSFLVDNFIFQNNQSQIFRIKS